MIFAREISDPLTSLVKQLDAITGKNKSADMGSFVVFCSDDAGLEKKLQELAKKQGLKHTILSIDEPAGPEDFGIVKDADVTVVLYNQFKVEANYAFKKGQMKDADIAKIIGDLAKILPAKK
jgi:hypothetical protein